MNGELYHISCLVAGAKQALKTNTKIKYSPLKHENKTEFYVLKRKLFHNAYIAETVTAWFDNCLKNGLRDIKLFVPTSSENRKFLGFSNTTQSRILCYFKSGKILSFVPKWEFNSTISLWDIKYTEYKISGRSDLSSGYTDNSDEFASILLNIKNFANKIGCVSFANEFQNAIDILTGVSDCNNSDICLPDKNLRMFEAANRADMFGAMGSWNDTAYGMATEKGFASEYEKLSQELLKQLRYAILYSINEW